MKTPKERVQELSANPDIQKWMEKLKEVVETTPKDVWVFVAASDVCVMANREDGESYMHETYPVDVPASSPHCGVIQDAKMVAFSTYDAGHWDGGDW